MVSNKFFAALAIKLGFNKHLRSNSPAILNQIKEYITELEELERQAKGVRNYWADYPRDPPKVWTPPSR